MSLSQICGLRDQDLTLATAIEKARAAETVNTEILHFPMEADTLKLYNQLQQRPCHRCGQYGHTGATCIHKNKRCNVCKKIGHLSSVCWHAQHQATTTESKGPTHTMQASTDSSDEEFDTNQLHIYNTSKVPQGS